MIRSFKILALALGVLLALSAVAASTSLANPKLTPVPEEYPVTLKGDQTVAHVLELEGTRPTECAFVSSESFIFTKAEAEESEVFFLPSYANCTTTILGNKDLSTVTMNECGFAFEFTETTQGTIQSEGWEVTADKNFIVCPTGHEIEIHVFASLLKDELNEPLCTYKIKGQQLSGSVDYKLLEKNAEGAGTSAEFKLTLSGIATTRASGTLTNCGASSQSGQLKGAVKFEAFNSKGAMLRSKFDME